MLQSRGRDLLAKEFFHGFEDFVLAKQAQAQIARPVLYCFRVRPARSLFPVLSLPNFFSLIAKARSSSGIASNGRPCRNAKSQSRLKVPPSLDCSHPAEVSSGSYSPTADRDLRSPLSFEHCRAMDSGA